MMLFICLFNFNGLERTKCFKILGESLPTETLKRGGADCTPFAVEVSFVRTNTIDDRELSYSLLKMIDVFGGVLLSYKC